MASSKAKYMRRRRNAVLAAVALALILIIVIIVIIVGISKRGSGSGTGNLPTATPPQTALPTPNNNGIGNYNPTATTPGTVTPSPSPNTSDGTVMYVTGDGVNVRETASSSGRKLTTVSKGTAVTAGKLEDGWYPVTLANGIEGYISASFLSEKSPSSSNSPTPTPGATPDTSKGKTMYVTKDSVNVRDKASTSGKKLTQLSKGDNVTAFASQNGWTYIEYKKGSYGYISSEYLTETKPTTSATATTNPSPTPTAPNKTPISSWSEIENLPALTWDTSADSTSLATREKYLNETYAQTTTNMGGQTGVSECYKIKKIDGTIYYIAINTDNKANIYASLNDVPGTPVK